MENLCYFVSSRGLLKSCTFHSLNPKSSCNNNYLYLGYMLASGKMFHGMSIYVCSDLLRFFVSKILPKIQYKFVLLSGDSDLNVPKEALTGSEFNNLTQNSYLLKWFTQNTQFQDHPKIIQLPIGLDYHTISNNPNSSWVTLGEGTKPRFQEEILMNLRQQMKPFYERIPKIYVNFSTTSDRFKQRENAFKQIHNDLLAINQKFIKRTETWKNITNYSFVLSPFGNGMDCHRTWEALCLGAIPIVCAPNFRKMFEGLPVLIVSDWSQITRELLDSTIEEFKTRQFNYEKLTLQYWKNKINRMK